MTKPACLHIRTHQGPRTIETASGCPESALSDVLRHEGLPLNTRCEQRGLCGGCFVELTRGQLLHIATGRTVNAQDTPIVLRACEHALAGPESTIAIPPRSLLGHSPRVLDDFQVNVPVAALPMGGITDRPLGVAIDVGTTTVALLVLRCANGQIMGKASAFNRQMDLGDNVLTRINRCSTDPTMLGRLQRAVVGETIAPLLAEALDAAGASMADVACLVASGNTTMLHLLAGVDPSPIGVAPFTPVFIRQRILSAREIGLEATHDSAQRDAFEPPVLLLPSAAGYIGADLVAGVFASGLLYDDGPSLLVDIGTNGEIIAKHSDHLVGCATAAGPAFEGAGLTNGVRAAEGAISHVRPHTDPARFTCETLGEGKPIGLCGSAYIDLLAVLSRLGLLLPAGRFDPDHAVVANGRMKRTDYGLALPVARGLGGRDLMINEADIASLLQAKAAIAAGVLTLLARLHVRPADVRNLYLAGGFGMQLDIPNAIACGLLPGFDPGKIRLVGNTSLAGAYLTLLDRGVIDELETVRRRLEVIELNLDPGFESRFIDNLIVSSAP